MFLIVFILSLWPNLATAKSTVICKNLFELQTYGLQIKVAGAERTLAVYRKSQLKQAPVVIYFHGTNSSVEMNRPVDARHGLYHETQFIQKLVDAGYVVVAPDANRIVPLYVLPSVSAWEANVAPYSHHFETTRDYQLAVKLLENLPEITGVTVDPERIFLAGFSSGGYMASRLAQESFFAEKIRGLIIHSASYGLCIGNQCSVPRQLPPWHPDTLLISNKDDSVVPFHTVELYGERLQRNKISVDTIYSAEGEHAWREDHPELIFDWLKTR